MQRVYINPLVFKMRKWLQATPAVGHTLLMPIKPDTKEPMRCHHTKQWDWPELDAFLGDHPDQTWWGIILDRLLVVDCDTAVAVALVEQLGRDVPEVGEALAKCAVQETKKGFHYIFLRPAWADEERYFDDSRQVAGLEIDVKTICSTDARGLLLVAPSPHKKWVEGRAPWQMGDLPEAPRSLVEFVMRPKPPNPAPSAPRAPRAPGAGGLPALEVGPGGPPGGPSGPPDAVEKLLLLLAKTRWDTYPSWRDIGTALKNSFGAMYMETFDRMSRISANYDAAAAVKLWRTVARDNFDGPRLTVRTLEYWARADDPDGYAALRAASVPTIVKENWDGGDYGLAIVAHDLLRDTVKKASHNGDFYTFVEDGCRWTKVCEGRVKTVASETLDKVLLDVDMWLASQAATCTASDDDVRRRAALDAKKKKAAKLIDYVRSARGVANVMEFAGPLLIDETFEQSLDSHRHLIGIRGGFAVDLRSGEKRHRVPEDLIHVELQVDYDPEAPAPAWMHELVTTLMAGDEDMARFLQLLLGYGITGEVNEEVFPILTGGGRNGKGLLTQAIMTLMGGFYREMNVAIISNSRQATNIDAERAKLRGARIAVFNELDAGEKLKTSEAQLLSGGDGFPAKPMYKDPITIDPRHLVLLVTNYMPELNDVIPALMQRIMCIEFPVLFRDLMPGEVETPTVRQVDKTLKKRLKSPDGQAALFAWLVEGAVRWYKDEGCLKRSAPAKVTAFTRQYFEEQDSVQAFLTEHCEFGDGKRVSSANLLYHYRQAAERNTTDKWFHAQMKAKGFLKKSGMRIGGTKVMGYDGVGLKEGGDAAGADADDLE